jgi:hypothetical protein
LTLRNQLLALSGRAFDSVYIHSLAKDCERAFELFLQETVTGENEQLRDYSASLLPDIQLHLRMADSLAKSK